MTELFDDDKVLIADEPFVESNEVVKEMPLSVDVDARRRLENLLEERRLQSELDDFLD